MPVTPNWTTNGGTIDNSGVFTAPTSVAAGRLVTATSGSVSGTATVNIVAGSLATLTVSPSPVTVTVGTTQLFTAAGIDHYSNPVPVTPNWTTNGGTIDNSGVFTAPTSVAAGRLVTATSGSISGTAAVNIAAGPVTAITVQVNPATQIVNSGATSTITATAFDGYSNTVPGVSLSGNVQPSWMGSVSGLGTTGTNGQTTGTWTAGGTMIGNGTLNVINGSVTGQAAITLTVGEPYTITLRPNPTYLTVGNASTLLAYNIWDRFGNPVADDTVVTFTSSLGSTSPLTDTTVSGSAASSLNSKQAGVGHHHCHKWIGASHRHSDLCAGCALQPDASSPTGLANRRPQQRPDGDGLRPVSQPCGPHERQLYQGLARLYPVTRDDVRRRRDVSNHDHRGECGPHYGYHRSGLKLDDRHLYARGCSHSDA